MRVHKHFAHAVWLTLLLLGTILNNAEDVNPKVVEVELTSEVDGVLESERELLLVDLGLPFVFLV